MRLILSGVKGFEGYIHVYIIHLWFSMIFCYMMAIFWFSTRNMNRLCCGNGVADIEGGFLSAGKSPQDYPMKIVWKKGFIRLVLVGGILWMLLILIASLFHVWSCQSSISFFSGILF